MENGSRRVEQRWSLKTRARHEPAVDLTIAGSSLLPRDFEWLSTGVGEMHVRRVAAPLRATSTARRPPRTLSTVANTVPGHQLGKAPELACLCAADATELNDARSALPRSSDRLRLLHVRWGAVVLDVVGNDTAVGQELIRTTPPRWPRPTAVHACKRNSSTWARAQAYGDEQNGEASGSRRLAPVRGGRWKNKSSLSRPIQAKARKRESG